MGWASAGQIFDPVAKALVELNAPDDMKRRVLGDLIGALQDGDWDTEDESLDQFKDDPAIRAAFRDHDVVITCGSEDGPEGTCDCTEEIDHASDHRDYYGLIWPKAVNV